MSDEYEKVTRELKEVTDKAQKQIDEEGELIAIRTKMIKGEKLTEAERKKLEASRRPPE